MNPSFAINILGYDTLVHIESYNSEPILNGPLETGEHSYMPEQGFIEIDDIGPIDDVLKKQIEGMFDTIFDYDSEWFNEAVELSQAVIKLSLEGDL